MNFKDGRTLKKNYCIDCLEKGIKTKVSWDALRCKKCNNIYRWKNLNYKKETSKKISITKRTKKLGMGKMNGSYIDGRCSKTYYCIECGRKISYKTWNRGKKRCSSCATKGKNNSNYIDGRSYEKYPREFNVKLKEFIRKRDNDICKKCNMTQEEHFIVFGRNIEVHHIDYDRKNCNENNLITLCKQCNLRINRNRDYWKEFFKNKLLKI